MFDLSLLDDGVPPSKKPSQKKPQQKVEMQGESVVRSAVEVSPIEPPVTGYPTVESPRMETPHMETARMDSSFAGEKQSIQHAVGRSRQRTALHDDNGTKRKEKTIMLLQKVSTVLHLLTQWKRFRNNTPFGRLIHELSSEVDAFLGELLDSA